MNINHRRLEYIIYLALWLIAIMMLVCDMMLERHNASQPLFDLKSAGIMMLMLLPFLALFAINNGVLIPRLLGRDRYGAYFLSVVAAVILVWILQREIFLYEASQCHQPPPPGPHHPGPRHLLPLPLFLNIIYDFLIVGAGLAISLIFRQFSDRLRHESIKKESAENRLSYLKAQINPHFYLNMLNNIHGMIDIDPERAQEMVIEMSRLMRYMLYDSDRAEIALSAEIGFIDDYLALMRVRYPATKVAVRASLPTREEGAGISIPPLLFIVFLENSFKHGISYCEKSFVDVSLKIEGDTLIFTCANSLHSIPVTGSTTGIGLANARRRLDLLYGVGYRLDISTVDNKYQVTLTLPLHDTACPAH